MVIAFPNKAEVQVWPTECGRFAVSVFEEGHERFTRLTGDRETANAGAELLRAFLATSTPDDDFPVF